MTLDDIKTGLRARVLDVAMFLFPHGRREGKEWKIGGVDGHPSAKGKGSLNLCVEGLKAGAWADFASGEKGTLIDLWAMRFGYHGTDGWVLRAGEEAAQWLGGTFEKRMPDGSTQPVNGSAAEPAPSQRRAAPPADRHTNHLKRRPEPLPQLPSYADEWKVCVAAMTDRALGQLCEQRGYSSECGEWLRSEGLIGLHETRHGLALALPVHDEHGKVIAAHVRNRQKNADGTPIVPTPPKWQYRYKGEQSPGTRPLIIGDVAKAGKLWVFESQWDAFAVIDRLGLCRGEVEWPAIAIFITRGASNAALLSRYILEGRALVLWPQNDQPSEAGKIPAEEWVRHIVELAGNVPVRRVKTPEGFEDPNDWLKKCPAPPVDVAPNQPEPEGTVGRLRLFEAISQATPARTTKLPPMRDMAFAVRPENRSPIPAEVVRGILHRGSKMVIGGTSKGRKSFSLLDLAVAVSTGGKWWGFDCNQGRVLYLNFEIQQPFLESRVADIMEAREASIPPGHFATIPLRGMTSPVEDLAADLIAYILDLEPFTLIIFDPIYKLMAGKDENKAGDVGTIMAHLERVSVQTGAAIVFGAHYSKGNQSSKESIDRIGGSGVFARDPDAILTMTTHEVENAFTVEATLRNYKPIEPFVVGWRYPLFWRDESGLDPAALKMPKNAKNAGGGGSGRFEGAPPRRKNDRLIPALDMLKAVYAEIPRAMKWGEIITKAQARCLNSMGEPVKEHAVKTYIWKLRDDGFLAKNDATGQWTTTKAGDEWLDSQAATAEQQSEHQSEQQSELSMEAPQS